MTKHSYIKHPRAAVQQPWGIPELCKAYSWPNGTFTGKGPIGILEMSGAAQPSDTAQAFKAMGLLEPKVTIVSVDGTEPKSGDADAEVALDIQVAGAGFTVATKTVADLRVYYGQDFAAIVTKAWKDGCAVLSISWGAAEENWSKADIAAFTAAAKAATEGGMIITAASGDNSADDGEREPSVDFPASCPYVLACGGTSKPYNGQEVVWNNEPGHANGSGTGGGYSVLFPFQAWQVGALAGRGRMVPDVAANADPDTGYALIIGGQNAVVGGTSAVAPLYASLLAAAGQKGWFGPTAFKNPHWFVDIILGNNGTYKAAIGPDACTGLGVPIGHMFQEA